MEGSEFPAPHGLTEEIDCPRGQSVLLFPLSGFPRARASYRRSRGYGVVGVYLPPLFQSSSPFARPFRPSSPFRRKMCLFSDPTECTVQRASTAIERRAIADVNPLSKYLKKIYSPSMPCLGARLWSVTHKAAEFARVTNPGRGREEVPGTTPFPLFDEEAPTTDRPRSEARRCSSFYPKHPQADR